MSVGSSLILSWILVLAHIASGALLAVTDMPWTWKVVAQPIFLSSLILSLRRHAWRVSPTAVVALQLDVEGKAAFHRFDGLTVAGQLLGSSFVSPWLTVLNLKPEGRWHSIPLVILPDAMGKDDFRRLRVWLRWKSIQQRPG